MNATPSLSLDPGVHAAAPCPARTPTSPLGEGFTPWTQPVRGRRAGPSEAVHNFPPALA
jgi:hypothetical protein